MERLVPPQTDGESRKPPVMFSSLVVHFMHLYTTHPYSQLHMLSITDIVLDYNILAFSAYALRHHMFTKLSSLVTALHLHTNTDVFVLLHIRVTHCSGRLGDKIMMSCIHSIFILPDCKSKVLVAGMY